MVIQPIGSTSAQSTPTRTGGRVIAPMAPTTAPILQRKISQPQPQVQPQREPSLIEKAQPYISSAKTIFQNLQKAASSITHTNKDQGIGAPIGRLMQKVPNVDLGTKLQKTFKATDTETKIVNFISNFPSMMAQGYGKTLEQVSTKEGLKKLKEDAKNLPKTMGEVKASIDNKEWQKALEIAMSNSAITVGLDVSDFIPVTLVAKLGIKGITKGSKSLAKQVVKEGIEEAEKASVKTATKTTAKVAEKVVTPEIVKPIPWKPQTGGVGGAKKGVEIPQEGISTSPNGELPQVKPKEVSVPREQLPVGTGKEKASRLEARITDSLNKTPQEIKDQLGSTFNQMNKKENIAKAVSYISKNQEEAMAVLRGEKEAPKGILKNSIYVAMENVAKEDAPLARKLASLASTRAGQELSILTEIDPHSPVKAMSEVIKIREEVAMKKYGGRSVREVSDKIVKDIKTKVKVPDRYDWNSFLESVKCK